nr:MAG TPA: hypothetical protein [Caudoviricetes sp.]
MSVAFYLFRYIFGVVVCIFIYIKTLTDISYCDTI